MAEHYMLLHFLVMRLSRMLLEIITILTNVMNLKMQVQVQVQI